MEEGVVDLLGEGGAEDRDGRGEDDSRLVGAAGGQDLGAQRFEEVAEGHHVDVPAQIEIGLGLARDDGREVEYQIRAPGRETADRALVRDVAGQALGRRRTAFGREGHVEQRHLVAGVQRIACQRVSQFLADHAATADDQDFGHFDSSLVPAPPRRPGRDPRISRRLPLGAKRRETVRRRSGPVQSELDFGT